MEHHTVVANGTPDRKSKKYPVQVHPARVKGYGVIPIRIYFKLRGRVAISACVSNLPLRAASRRAGGEPAS
jgi:hypothetical protein